MARLLQLQPPYSHRLVAISPGDLDEALQDPVGFLGGDWPTGTTTLLEVVRSPDDARVDIVVNRAKGSVFFEAWHGSDFSEPCYDLPAAVEWARLLLEHPPSPPPNQLPAATSPCSPANPCVACQLSRHMAKLAAA